MVKYTYDKEDVVGVLCMRMKDNSKNNQILNYINDYYGQYARSPSLREISAATGIPRATVQRYMVSMDRSGEVVYKGRNVSTITTRKMAAVNCIPVLGRVSCGPGEEEKENILDYIRMPENLVGKGDFFALIAKGESMISAGIYEGDYVIVKQINVAKVGDIIVALYDNRSNLKMLGFDEEKGQYCLRSLNPDKEKYADIYVSDLIVQGVAVGVYHYLMGQNYSENLIF